MMKKKEKTTSPFWKPITEGESVEGKFVRWEKTQFGVALRLDTALVPMGYQLRDLFSAVYRMLTPKSKITIQYLGLAKGKRGRRTKLFEAYVDGKKLQRQGVTYGEEPSTKELESYFDLPF